MTAARWPKPAARPSSASITTTSTSSRRCCRAIDWRRPGMILIDGVNSMTGNAPDLHAFAELAREHGALLYVDDAHGFGVIGERSSAEACDYGARGNSIVRHLGETYDNVVLVGGLLQGLLLAAGLPRLPDPGQAGAQDRRAAVPVLRPVAGGLAGHGARGPAGQRAARRASCAASSTTSRGACLTASRSWASTRPTSPASRSSRSRWPMPTASTTSATCSSTAAST